MDDFMNNVIEKFLDDEDYKDFLTEITYNLPVKEDDSLPPEPSFLKILKRSLDFKTDNVKKLEVFEKLISKIFENASKKEEKAQIYEAFATLYKLIIDLGIKMHIVKDQKHFVSGIPGDTWYFLYKEGMWHLAKVQYTLADTTEVKKENILIFKGGDLLLDYKDPEDEPKDTSFDLYNIVKDQITSILGKIEALKDLSSDFTNQLILSITTSALSIITSVTTMASENLGRTTKVLNGTNIVCSLTTLVHGLYASLKQYDPEFNVTAALQLIPSSIKLFDKNVNTISNSSQGYLSYLKPAIALIVAVIIGGLTTFGVSNAKDIINAGNLSKAYREINTDINEVVGFIIKDICEIDTNGDKIINKELIDLALEAGELAITPVYKFCTNPELKQQLLTFQKRYQELASKRHKDVINSKVAMSAKTTVNNLLSQIIGIIKAVKDVGEQCGRQETLAIMLAGAPGIGKSTMIPQLQRHISQALGYPNESYDLTKETPDKFFTTYGGQSYGRVDEFMGTSTRNDGFLKSFNKIVSGDHVNLEGSGLEQKYQPANFKAVFLTSNDICPMISNDDGLKIETAKAVWSRTIRVLVEDPLYKGRMDRNVHRQKDNSHLSFKIVPLEAQSEIIGENVLKKLQPITFDNLKDMLVQQMARREINFLQKMEVPEINGNPIITNPEDHAIIEKRIQELERIVGMANAGGKDKEFFVVRMQGLPGVGKTRLARILSASIQKFRKSAVYVIDDFKVQPCETQGIYILDDILYTDPEKIAFLNWINKGHTQNMYIVCSNSIYKTNIASYKDIIKSKIIGTRPTKYFDIQATGVDSAMIPTGYFRRIGLYGSIKTSLDGIIQNSTRYNQTITFDKNGSLNLNGNFMSEEQVINQIYIKYLLFLKNSTDLVFTEDMAPIFCEGYDVEIKSPSIEELCEAMSSVYNIRKCMAFGYKRTKVILKPSYKISVDSSVTEEDWVVPKTASTETEKEQLFIRMIRSLLKISEDPKVLVKVAEYNWVYSKGIIYKQGISKDSNVTFKNGLVYYQNICITPVMYYKFLTSEIENMADFNITEISSITTFIENLPQKNRIIYDFQKQLLDNHKDYNLTLIQYMQKFKNNKYIWIGAGLCVFVASATLIYKMIPKNTPDKKNVKSNSSEDENHALSKVTSRYIQAVLKGDLQQKTQIKQEAFDAGHGAKFNQWEYEWRSGFESNSGPILYDPKIQDKDSVEMVRAILKSDDEKAKIDIIREYPHYLSVLQSNMLTDKEEKHSTKNAVDIFRHSLLKNMVLIKPSSQTFHYGLGYRDRYIITVSHGISDDQKTLSIGSNGNEYIAHVVRLNRKRDLALLYIKDKTFPVFKDLTSKFIMNESLQEVTDFWYVRVSSQDSLVVSVNPDYIESTPVPRQDMNNSNFQLQSNFFRVHFFTAAIKKIIRDGDCGMPLIGFHDNQPFIAGIHNSYTGYGLALFSSLDAETFDALGTIAQANEGKIPKDKLIYHPKMKQVCVIDEQYRQALGKDPESSRFSQGDLAPLAVIGYYPELHIKSNPKHKKVFHKIEGAQTKCETLPSCINFIEGKTNPEPLKKDIYGKPHTLFTQAFKYSVLTPEYKQKLRNKYELEIQYTLKMLKYKTTTNYGSFKTLNNKEILNGMEYLKPFDVTTSPGPALKKKFGITNKEKILKNTNPDKAGKPFYIFDSTNEGNYVKNQFMEFNAAVEDGIPIFALSKNNAKVELLPVKDVIEKSKVRLFNELDFSLNLVLRKYFGYAINNIMSKCGEKPYCIGANSYTIATDIMMVFNLREGEIQSSDYSSFDKSLCKEIIEMFVEVFCDYADANVKDSLTKTLQYTAHVLDGHVYFVNHGNESGSVVTTLLNCFAQDFIDTFTAIRIYKENHNMLPSYSIIDQMFKAFYLGDDGVLKVSFLEMTIEERQHSAALFNMKLTPPKVISKYVSFCSREFVPDTQSMVYYPRLKTSSITSCLYYYEKHTKEQITANINVALFEAALHDQNFFNSIKHDVMIIARHNKIANKIALYTYEEYRNHFKGYILHETKSPILLTIGNQNEYKEIQQYITQLENNNLENSNQEILQSNFKKIMERKNYTVLLKELFDKHQNAQPNYEYTKQGSEDSPIWKCKSVYTVNGSQEAYEASGFTKNACKNKIDEMIYLALLKEREESLVKSNNGESPIFDFVYEFDQYSRLYICRITHKESKRVMQIIYGKTKRDVRRKITTMYFDAIPLEYTEKCVKEQMKVAHGICKKLKMQSIYVYVDRESVLETDDNILLCGTQRYILNKGKVLCLNATSQQFSIDEIYPYYDEYNIKKTEDGLLYSLCDKPNMEREIAPDAIRGTAVNQQASGIPIGQMNPQPTGQVMAIAPAGQDAINAIEAIKHQTLNPLGAPNMSTVGAVMFTLPQLCYTQFLDSDKEYVISDQSASGTIIMQIPYDPQSEFVNSYIKQWVSLHERYQGALQFRITVVGNPMFSGFIGVSWQPKRYPGSSMPISELQKYAYDSKGVTLPWSEIHTLHDARQDLFYRTIFDKDNIADRPHLVIALVASIQNPLKENAIVRIRLASKLSNEPNSFFSSFKPILGPGPTPPPVNTVIFKDIFNTTDKTYMTTDGTSVIRVAEPTIVESGRFNRTLLQNTIEANTTNITANNPFMMSNLVLERNDETTEFFQGVPADFTRMQIGIIGSTSFNSLDKTIGQAIYDAAGTNKTMETFVQNEMWAALKIQDYTIFSLAPVANSGTSDGLIKVFQQIYVVGRRGAALVAFVGFATHSSSDQKPNVSFPIDAYGQKVAPFNQFIIQSVISSSGDFNVPTGYTSIQFVGDQALIPSFSNTTNTAASVITGAAYRKQFAAFLKNRGIISQYVDIDLFDNVNNVLVASMRFTPNEAYVRASEVGSYKTFNQDISMFEVRNIRGVEIGDILPQTDTSNWLNRKPTSFTDHDITNIIRMLKQRVVVGVDTTSNAGMIAAGAIQGLGQGLTAYENFNFQKFLQQNAFEQQTNMQKGYFDGSAHLRGALTQSEMYKQQSSANTQPQLEQPTVDTQTGELNSSNTRIDNTQDWNKIASLQETNNLANVSSDPKQTISN